MRVVAATKTTVTVRLTRKEAIELRALASNEIDYFNDAIHEARDREKRRWQRLRDLWQRRYEQLDLAVLAIARNQKSST